MHGEECGFKNIGGNIQVWSVYVFTVMFTGIPLVTDSVTVQ